MKQFWVAYQLVLIQRSNEALSPFFQSISLLKAFAGLEYVESVPTLLFPANLAVTSEHLASTVAFVGKHV